MIALRQWALTAGQWTGAVTDMGGRVRIAAYPAAGGAYSMYGSTSPHIDIQADQSAGRLSYANFNGGDLSTLSSNWVLWASGGVTVPSTEGQEDSSGWTAVIATATGGAGTSNLEVVQDP